jgi:hypothetical protein
MWKLSTPSSSFSSTAYPLSSSASRIAAKSVSYGWGMIPVRAGIGDTEWKTSLFPKDGRYIVPVKAGVRKALGLEEGDTVSLRLAVGAGSSK